MLMPVKLKLNDAEVDRVLLLPIPSRAHPDLASATLLLNCVMGMELCIEVAIEQTPQPQRLPRKSKLLRPLPLHVDARQVLLLLQASA